MFLLEHWLPTGETRLASDSIDVQTPSAELINGRYLINTFSPVTDFDGLNAIEAIHTIFDTQTGKIGSHGGIHPDINLFPQNYQYDWAEEDDWFLILEDGLLRLVSAKTNQQQLLFHRFMAVQTQHG
ncbi:MAG: hypothetical protein AAF614_21225 [Chloroflexota bacterium]